MTGKPEITKEVEKTDAEEPANVDNKSDEVKTKNSDTIKDEKSDDIKEPEKTGEIITQEILNTLMADLKANIEKVEEMRKMYKETFLQSTQENKKEDEEQPLTLEELLYGGK